MSEHEKRLRKVLVVMSGVVPKIAGEALEVLEGLLAEQCLSGLDEAMGVFSRRQAEFGRQRVASKSRSSAEIADMKAEAARCSWAIHILRPETGPPEEGQGETG